MAYFGKFWIKALFKGFAIILVLFSFFSWYTYNLASQTVDAMFPELVRLVAEDNCLDNTIAFNGKTTYAAYADALAEISNASAIISFEADAISVPYTSRASAPQRGTSIPVKLTGYWTLTIPLFSGWDIHYPIVREIEVIGIREYRDR